MWNSFLWQSGCVSWARWNIQKRCNDVVFTHLEKLYQQQEYAVLSKNIYKISQSIRGWPGTVSQAVRYQFNKLMRKD